MIDFSEQYYFRERMRQEALGHFNQIDESHFKWTPQRSLSITVAQPASDLEYYQDEVDQSIKLAPYLAGEKQLITELRTANDTVSLIISGEGAQNVALAIRNELEKNFSGASNLPGKGYFK